MEYLNHEGPDQNVHPHSMISASKRMFSWGNQENTVSYTSNTSYLELYWIHGYTWQIFCHFYKGDYVDVLFTFLHFTAHQAPSKRGLLKKERICSHT